MIGAAVAAAVVVGFALGQALLSGGDEEVTTRPPDVVSVTAALSPTVHAFGDPVDATVDVVVDADQVDLGSVQLQPTFDPYERVGPPVVERTRSGPVGRVTYRYRLVCLREGCDAAEARGVSDLPLARVRYRFADRAGNAFEAFDWPLLEVASRVADEDVEQIRWRAEERELPAVSYRFGATGAAVLLVGLAVALALASVLLAWRLWRPQRAAVADEERGAPRSALERALDAALEAADGDGAPERRRALERAARELAAHGRAELADDARALAWAPRGASADDIAGLAARAGVAREDGRS